MRDQRGDKIIFVLVLVLARPSIPINTRLIEDEDENEDESENKKAFTPGKTENKGIQRILTKTVRQAGLILLFAEKWPDG